VSARKRRGEIPRALAAQVLFVSDRTCCICRDGSKPVQIHHIDEDPSNTVFGNLAVLCFDCHRDTQIRGGFDRKLDGEQVTLYRDDWLRVVARKRASAEVRTDREARTDVQLELATSIAEIYRENGEWPLLAAHYDEIGNTELRDKYIEAALGEDPDDSEIFYLRDMQGRPDLIPPDVAERELARRAERNDWTERARRLITLGRVPEGIADYLKAIQEDVKAGRYFPAAFYLKEIFREELVEELFKLDLQRSIDERNLWWQVRCLEELGWKAELVDLLKENAAEIRRSLNPELRSLLAWAENNEEEYVEMRKAAVKGTTAGPGGVIWFKDLPADDADSEIIVDGNVRVNQSPRDKPNLEKFTS
jgi:hypothetical protein